MTGVPTVTISGTDPSNPKCADDIVREVYEMEQALTGMAYRARQLQMFAGSIRDQLLDQRQLYRQAQESSDLIQRQMRTLVEALSEAGQLARKAGGAMEESGVIPHASFEWRPGVPGKR